MRAAQLIMSSAIVIMAYYAMTQLSDGSEL